MHYVMVNKNINEKFTSVAIWESNVMDIDSIIASYGAHVPYIIYYEWKVYGSSRKHLLPENTQKHQKIYRVL